MTNPIHDVAHDLIDSLCRGTAAVFVGAGFSRTAGLPTVRDLLPVILAKLPLTSRQRCRIRTARIPFEGVIDTLARSGDVSPLLELYVDGTPTRNHLLLAHLARRNRLRLVGTTNFDLLIERACESRGMSQPKDYVVSQGAVPFSRRGKNPLVVVKTHGSAEDVMDLVITLKQVARRYHSAEQRQFLRHLLIDGKHSVVVFLGYSCSDVFDINPQIASMHPGSKRVFLVEHAPRVRVPRIGPLVKPLDRFAGSTVRVDTDHLINSLWYGVFGKSVPPCRVSITNWRNHVTEWSRKLGQCAKGFAAAELLRQTGRYRDAVKLLRSTIELAKRCGDHEEVRRAYGSLGTCLRALGENRAALTNFELGRELAVATGTPREECRFVGDIGTIHRHLGEYAHAIRVQRVGLKLARSLQDPLALAVAHLQMGNTMQMLGRSTAALGHYGAALTAARKGGDKRFEALSYANIGAVQLLMGRIRIAERASRKAHYIADLVGDQRVLASSLNNLGTSAEQRGVSLAAINRFEQMLNIGRLTGVAEIEYAALANLASAQCLVGDYSYAERLAKESLMRSVRARDANWQIRAYCALGQAQARLDRDGPAYVNLIRALKKARRIKDLRGQTICLNRLAEYHRDRGANKRAVECAELALGIARHVRDAWGAVHARYSIAVSRENLNVRELRGLNRSFVQLGAKRRPEVSVIGWLVSEC
jgi:tetratricopeptide (TPR) repeat protein